MKFEEVVPLLRDGKKIRRSLWQPETFVHLTGMGVFRTGKGNSFELTGVAITEDDWEEYQEPFQFAFGKIYKDTSGDRWVCIRRIFSDDSAWFVVSEAGTVCQFDKFGKCGNLTLINEEIK